MSSTARGLTQEKQHITAQDPMNVQYIPTEEEINVFKECNRESFWYRSMPLAVTCMALTQALISKGMLSGSPRFGSLTKVACAGLFGYLTGKVSYTRTCQEKFKKLENSPLGDAMRMRAGLPPKLSKGPQSEMSDPDTPSFDTMFQPAEAHSQTPTNTRDYEYSYNSEPSTPMVKADYLSDQGEEEEPRRKPILYEDLRLKNRENYEVTLTQKAETLLKSPEKEPKKDVKKNIYGDTWED